MIILRQKQFSLVSRIYTWISDIQKIDPLPITKEEFIRLCFTLELGKNGLYKRVPQTDLLDKLDKYYNLTGAGKIINKVGLSFALSQFPEDRTIDFKFNYPDDKYFKKAVDYAWERIQKIPKRYITKALGQGAWGIVFAWPGGKIEKISYRGFVDYEVKFYKYQKKNKIPIVPKIYTLEDDHVIMERLALDTPKVKQYKEWIEEYVEKIPGASPRLPNIRKPLWDKIYSELGEGHEFVYFLKTIEKEIEKIYGVKYTVGDLTKSNIGERTKTGEIVFFDPATDGIDTGGLKYNAV